MLAPATNPVNALGGVDRLEVHGKGPDQEKGRLGRIPLGTPGVEKPDQLLPGVGLTGPTRDRGPPDSLDPIEKRRSGLLPDDLPQYYAQSTDIVPQERAGVLK